jgi:hypothetical protein
VNLIVRPDGGGWLREEVSVCLTVYVAADVPLNPPYAPEVGGLRVDALPAAEAAAIRAFSKPHVVMVGFWQRCGCFVHYPDQRPRRELVWLLEWALRMVPEVEVFICNPDQEGEEPAIRDWTSATELLAWRVLDGGMFLTVVRDWVLPVAEGCDRDEPGRSTGPN